MALERRGNNYYRYKKRRVGNRVVSEYCGGGQAANLQQLLDRANRQDSDQEKESRRRTLEAEKRKQAEMDSELEHFSREAKALLDAIFLINGYHTHERQWRKKRNGNEESIEETRNYERPGETNG
jgi:hypothetical protein